VFKASELSPKTHHMLAEAFIEAGVPKGVINVIQTNRDDAAAVTETLIAHRAIRKIEFIGSTGVGSKIAQVAAKYLKPVLMEMGDKAAAIVLEDANLDAAATTCIFGGQYFHHLAPPAHSRNLRLCCCSVYAPRPDLLRNGANHTHEEHRRRFRRPP